MDITAIAPRKAILPVVLVLFAMNTLGIMAGVIYYLHTIDEMAKQDLKSRVELAIGMEQRIYQDILEEYSWWDESHEKCVQAPDPKWIKENTGNYLFDKYGLDFTFALGKNSETTYHACQNASKCPEVSRLTESGLALLLDTSRRSGKPTKTITGYMRIGNAIYRLSLGPFIDETDNMPRPDGSHLVFGRKLDKDYLRYISTMFKLPPLGLTDMVPENYNAVVLPGPSGKPLSYITYEPPTPSALALPWLLSVVGGFFLIMIAITWYLLCRINTNQDKHEAQLYAMATTDALTGLSNRRHFFEHGKREHTLYLRTGRPFSILMMDLDDFKAVNDTYGHQTGDKTLRQVAHTIQSCLRQTDMLGRLGGEEFAVLLPDTSEKQAIKTAERIRVRVEAGCGDRDIPEVTLSIGVATSEEGLGFEDVLRLADDVLYAAKDKGRNKVVVNSQDEGQGQTSST